MDTKKLNVKGIVPPDSKRLMGRKDFVISIRDYATYQFKAYGQNSRYFRALAEQKKIYATRCKEHGVFLPPRPFCPDCQTRDMQWIDYTKQPAHIKTSSICNFAGRAFIDEVPFILGFIQVGEAKTVMSSVVKLSEDPAENTRMLNKLMNEKRYYELNGLKVEPRFAQKPLYTVRDLWFQVADKKFLDSLKETSGKRQSLT
jgi:uncharacterized OB-fold protein